MLAKGRGNIFRDFAAQDNHSNSEIQEFAHTAVAAFEETENLTAHLEQAIANYAKASPAFIDEFLSPEGIITKKRGIDENIATNRIQAMRIAEENARLKDENAELAVKIDSYKETLSKLRINQAQMQAQLDSGRQQISLLKRSLTTETASLRDLEDELFGESKAADEIEEQLEDVQSELSEIEYRGQKLAAELNDLDAEIAQGNQDVSGKQALLRKKEDKQDAVQAQYERLDRHLAATDIEIKNIKKDDLRKSLGMVLQDVNLFTGTIRENIKYGKVDATDEDVIKACKLANAHDFITRLPNGYDTMLTENGSQLSQGQRQLLSIARAALANPPVMILDEATSSIDTRTELKIQNAFAKMMQGRTSFIVAHRLSTIKEADVILVMRDGNIIEQGDHETLLAQNGFYTELYNSQFAG